MPRLSEVNPRRRLPIVAAMTPGEEPDDSPLAPVMPLRPRRRRDILSQWPITVVLLIVVVAVAFVALDEFRIGSLLLAVGVLVAFVLRLILPPARAGLLVVRSRPMDLVVLGLLGSALLVFALWVPPPS